MNGSILTAAGSIYSPPNNVLELAEGFVSPNPALTVYRRGGKYTTDLTAASLRPSAPTVTYFVNAQGAVGSWAAGNDANDGLSRATAKKSISALITALNASPPAGWVEIVLRDGGYYSTADGFNNTTVSAYNLSVIVENNGLAWLPSGRTGLEFVLGSGTIYRRVGHTAVGVIWFGGLGTWGEPTRLTQNTTAWANEAAVYAGLALGQWTMFAGNCYIRLPDDSVPGVDTMTIGASATTLACLTVVDRGLFLRGLRFTGLGCGISWRSRFGAARNFGALNVWVAGSNGTRDLFEIDNDDGLNFMQGCRADFGGKDGFNYHQYTTYNGGYTIELDCAATNNGSVSSDNGTTIHEAYTIVRINGVYVRNNSRNLHDINTSRSVNIGCIAGLSWSTASGQDIAFNSGQGGLSASGARMWLIDCQSAGRSGANGVDYYAAELSTMMLIGTSGQDSGAVFLKDTGATFVNKGATQVGAVNASRQGTARLVAGSVVVSTTFVRADSLILVTSQADGGTVGSLRVSARTAGTSFTITSSSGSDTSLVGWQIINP